MNFQTNGGQKVALTMQAGEKVARHRQSTD